jgi:hypothetical protein
MVPSCMVEIADRCRYRRFSWRAKGSQIVTSFARQDIARSM